jgi:hypothetical protein
LLRELGEQAAERFQRGGVPLPGLRGDPEVDPGGGEGGVDDPEVHRRLHGHVLEIRRPSMEQQGLLTIVERQLGQRGCAGPEPERQACARVLHHTLAEVLDVGGGVGPQVVEEGVSGDVSHDDAP